MASVQKAKSGKGYTVRYRVANGKERSRTFPRQVEAKAFAAEVEVARRRGTAVDTAIGSQRFEAFAAEWMAMRLAVDWRVSKRGWKPKTATNYESLMRTWLVPTFGGVRLDRIVSDDVQHWVDDIAHDLSDSRVLQAYRLLHQVLDFARKKGAFAVNPAADVDVDAVAQAEMSFLKAVEVERIVHAMPTPWNLVVLIQAYGGLRIGEALGLQRRHCDLAGSKLVVDQSVGEAGGKQFVGPTKTRQPRDAVLPPDVTALVDEHLRAGVGMDANSFLFAAGNGSALRYSNYRTRLWKPALVAAGVENLGTHALRHTFVALAWDSGNDFLTISRQCGHSTVKLTMDRYGHIFEGKREQLRTSMGQVRADALLALPELDPMMP